MNHIITTKAAFFLFFDPFRVNFAKLFSFIKQLFEKPAFPVLRLFLREKGGRGLRFPYPLGLLKYLLGSLGQGAATLRLARPPSDIKNDPLKIWILRLFNNDDTPFISLYHAFFLRLVFSYFAFYKGKLFTICIFQEKQKIKSLYRLFTPLYS